MCSCKCRGARALAPGSISRPIRSADGASALKIWNEYKNQVQLLFTDVVMPEGVSGTDLAVKLIATKPRLKVLFASGYSMDTIDTGFLRKEHANFVQKPYTHASLAKAVRECLDKE